MDIEYCYANKCKYMDYYGFCKFIYKDKRFLYPLDATCVKELIVVSRYVPEGLIPIEVYRELKLKEKYGFK